MQVELNKMNGKSTESMELNEAIFNLKPDFSVISSLVRWNESNKKPLRARTKNRSEVAGTTQKLGRQKVVVEQDMVLRRQISLEVVVWHII